MAEDGSDVEIDQEGGPGLTQEESGLDKDGYHVVSNRGKFQAQLNPLQLKMQEEKRKAEERKKAEEKKNKLAALTSKFGGAAAGSPSAAASSAAAEKKDPTPSKKVPEPEKKAIDSRVGDMMKSESCHPWV